MFSDEPEQFNVEIVKSLLEANADPNILVIIDDDDIQYSFSILMIISILGMSEMVKLLLDYNADSHYSIQFEEIQLDAFIIACMAGNMETVRVLRDNTDLTPHSLSMGWYHACGSNHKRLMSELVHSVPQLSVDQRMLITACMNNDLATFSNSLHHPDVEFVHGVTLLMIACSCGRISIVKALLNAEFGKKAIDFIFVKKIHQYLQFFRTSLTKNIQKKNHPLYLRLNLTRNIYLN